MKAKVTLFLINIITQKLISVFCHVISHMVLAQSVLVAQQITTGIILLM